MRQWQLVAQLNKPQRYEVVLENWLDTGETIATAIWSAPAGVAVTDTQIQGNAVSAVITASVASCNHVISVDLTTSANNQRQLSYKLAAE